MTGSFVSSSSRLLKDALTVLVAEILREFDGETLNPGNTFVTERVGDGRSFAIPVAVAMAVHKLKLTLGIMKSFGVEVPQIVVLKIFRKLKPNRID
jgi:hypothetical protein